MKAGGDWHLPFFDNLMSMGIDSFAFAITGDQPALVFNPDYSKLDFHWYPVVNKLFWSLKLDSVEI